MEITCLKLYTSKIDDLKKFYTETIDVELLESGKDFFSLRIGTTTLTFKACEKDRYYHFAINIPSFQISEAYHWIKQRTEVLPFHGDEIVDFKAWNAEALYFYDPAGNIVELIARKNLEIESNSEFNANSFLHISEIGLPVKNVKNAFQILHSRCGLNKYSGDYERFCAIGSETGLFITIDYKQKDWIPNGDKAFPFPFKMTFNHNQRTDTIVYKEEILSIE